VSKVSANLIGGKTYRRQNISAEKRINSKMYQWENVFVAKCISVANVLAAKHISCKPV
jgi:hypothetical protein